MKPTTPIPRDPIAAAPVWQHAMPPALEILRQHRYQLAGMTEAERDVVRTWLAIRRIALGPGPAL